MFVFLSFGECLFTLRPSLAFPCGPLHEPGHCWSPVHSMVTPFHSVTLPFPAISLGLWSVSPQRPRALWRGSSWAQWPISYVWAPRTSGSYLCRFIPQTFPQISVLFVPPSCSYSISILTLFNPRNYTANSRASDPEVKGRIAVTSEMSISPPKNMVCLHWFSKIELFLILTFKGSDTVGFLISWEE